MGVGELPQDLQTFDKVRNDFLLGNDSTQKSWFEISCRFGKQLSMDSWKKEFAMLEKEKKLVKMVGFDGANAMLGVPGKKCKANSTSTTSCFGMLIGIMKKAGQV